MYVCMPEREMMNDDFFISTNLLLTDELIPPFSFISYKHHYSSVRILTSTKTSIFSGIQLEIQFLCHILQFHLCIIRRQHRCQFFLDKRNRQWRSHEGYDYMQLSLHAHQHDGRTHGRIQWKRSRGIILGHPHESNGGLRHTTPHLLLFARRGGDWFHSYLHHHQFKGFAAHHHRNHVAQKGGGCRCLCSR